MIHLSKLILTLWFCCLFTQTILCSTTNINRSSEEFLSKLRSNIKLRKKYVEGKKLVEFTLLRVAGNDIDMTDFRKLNQRLGGRDEPEKQICIITLRNNCKSSSTNAENCMVRLIRGLQIHLNHNGNAVLLDEVGVSIDFIKEAYISDYDKITKTTSEFYGKFTKLEEIIIDNLYMISCDAFRDIFMVTMFDFLCTIDKPNYKDQTFPGFYLKKSSKNKTEELRKILMGLVNTGRVISKPRVNFWRNTSAESAILCKMYKYEKDNCVKILSKRYQYVEAYYYLLKVKYKTAYKESTVHLIISICNALVKSEIAERFTKYFSVICRDFLDFYFDLKDSNKLRSTFKDNVNYFCRFSHAFLDKTQSFSNELFSEDMMRIHNETIQPLAETLKHNLKAECVTRIFYDKKLTRKTVYQLCSILQNSNAFSDFCKHQFIYINSGKGIQKGEEHTLIDRCEAILSAFQSFDSVMEIKSTVQTLNESTKTRACQMFTYTRQNVAGKIETNAYSDLTKKANRNMITIDKYTEPMGDTARKEHIEKCIKKYVDDAKNIIFESWVITVISEHNQSLIYMITYGKDDVIKERVLLIFDMPFADRPANYLDSKHSDRYIRCIEDAQEPVLHNLNDNLQALQLAACTKLHIPNVCCGLAEDYTYTEKIFTETGFNSPKEFVYEYITSTQLTSTIHHLCKRIPITKVLDYKKNGCLNTNYLFNILAEQGISMHIFEKVLRRLIKTERSSGSLGMVPTTNNGLSDFRKIEIFYGLHANGTITFYMFEVREISFIKNSITNPIKLLCKMLDHQELCGLYKALDLTQNYNCKTTFLTSIIDIICRLIFDKNYHKSSRKFLIDFALCLYYVEDSIREHKKSMVSTSDTCRGRSDKPITLFQKAFDKLVDPNDIIYFAKTIVQELQILSSARVIVINSVKIQAEKISSQPEPDSIYTILRKIVNL